ncbi:LOW QUALITY PROTEIN: FAS-associated death domain protein-like [Zalophus californianus]|uniref:LOW QUALITY PROTEIN: FAS-associated death domain protein-like n=1 Tax=Zalophus californianus TaxID=9704 RepID=A0A6P9F388_ZALCA|nr:LOW QUALITY PROTEIN: FAS-associated death domain protein-like [Zalophus californianus]
MGIEEGRDEPCSIAGRRRGGQPATSGCPPSPRLAPLSAAWASGPSGELTELKLLCQGHVRERKLERVLGGLDLCSVLLGRKALGPAHPGLLLRRCLHDAGAPPEGRDLRATFDSMSDNVGYDWRRPAPRLKVCHATIDAVTGNYPHNLTEWVRESLRDWKGTEREAAAVSRLARALRACQPSLVAHRLLEDQQAPGASRTSSRGGRSSSAVSQTSWDSEGPALGAPGDSAAPLQGPEGICTARTWVLPPGLTEHLPFACAVKT